jgi:hypothetical protein
MERKKTDTALLCGILGCVCFCAGDWLMMYGDTTYHGSIYWLTEGIALIPAWRNSLAMLLAFPGILFYGIALFFLAVFIRYKRERKRYQGLTALGMAPWLCIHLFIVMILYAFAWMNQNGLSGSALPVVEALWAQYLPVLVIGEILMVLPFLYWFWTVAQGKTELPRWMAVSNPLLFYAVLKLLVTLMPDRPARLGFTNGLMSESMALWFISLLAWAKKNTQRT